MVSLPLNYVHDTTLFQVVDKPAVSAGRLNYDLNKTSDWAEKWLVPVIIDPVKSRNFIIFS